MKPLCKLFTLLLLMPLGMGCGDDDEKLPTTPGGTDSQELVLTIHPETIYANGLDTARMTIRLGDIDVTDLAVLKADEKVTNVRNFVTKTAGVYTFYAAYKGKVSNKVQVTALPDTAVVKDYRHRVLMIQHTGTWCGYCPRVSYGIYTFLNTDSRPDDVVFMAAHSSDMMSNAYSNAVNSGLGITGYPTMTVNLKGNTRVNTDTSDPEQLAKYIRAATTTALRNKAKSGAEVEVGDWSTDHVLTVKGTLFVNTTARYRIAAWLLEDHIHASQNSVYGFPADIIDNHNNVIRTASTSTIQGEFLTAGGQLDAGGSYPFEICLDAKDANILDYNNCHVAVVVTSSSNGAAFTVDNVFPCSINGKLALETE